MPVLLPIADAGFPHAGCTDAFYAKGALASIALADYPYPANFIAPLPANPVQQACAALIGTPTRHDARHDVLRGLHQAVLGLVNATRDLPCVDLSAELVGRGGGAFGSSGRLPPSRLAWATAADAGAGARASLGDAVMGVTAWNYQACTELLLEPMSSDGYGFYPPSDSQLASETLALCARRFDVEPRPAWMPLAFGRAADFRHASNIIFMENDKDPWHVGTLGVPPLGGVNGTVSRVLARGGAHHQDLRAASPLDAPDVVRARDYERESIRAWLRS